jgi:transposase-like protein
MSRTRRHFSPEQKAQVVRRHLADKQPVSQLAEELQVQPSLIHVWVNQLLTQAQRVFETPPANAQGRVEQAKDRRIEQLQAKLVQKNEVIAELMEDNVRQKKVAGEL